MKIAYLNNQFIPLDEAKVSILDRGFQYGDGVFETMRSYEGVVFRLERHMARLFHSLKALRIQPEVSKAKMQEIVYELLEKNELKSTHIKIIVTRGTVAIYTLPYEPLPERVYRRGVRLYICEAGLSEKYRLAGFKTLNYLHNFLCRDEARRNGFDDAVLINMSGHISEASTSNIFLVKGKKLYTPNRESGILPGITRDEVIRLARRHLNGRIREGLIKVKALRAADEIFLTNSLAEIMPAVKIGKRVLGKRKPGPVTEKLRALYKDAVKKYCEKGDEK
jgi:branched-chain amino acid aminotransferase